MRTSYAAGHPQVTWRDGYRVIRKAGRYLVFPRAAFSEMMGWHGGRDGLVEIWNGMPFFSPLWSRTAHVTWLHHVHAEMWQMTLPPRLAAFGNFVESKVAPPIYHRTLDGHARRSRASARWSHDLGFRADRVSVVPPGIDPHYTPGGEKSPTPLVVAVGRLVPVKQFDVLVDALLALKADHPDLEAVIVGEGYTREELEAQIHAARAESWIHAARSHRRGRQGRPTTAGLGARQRVGARGVGDDHHRGGRVRHALGGERRRRPRRRGRRRRDRHPLSRGGDALTRRSRPPAPRRRPARAAMSAAARATRRASAWEATARGTLEVLAAAAIARRGGAADR